MTIITERKYAGEFLISEASGTRSRDAIVIASGQGVLYPGQLLGKVTATKKYVAYKNDATDGSEVAAAILYDSVDATAVDANGVGVVRDAEIAATLLTGLDDAARADLDARGLILRA